jgi:formylglycine-generating enzyme required for sulfatase activity
MVYVPQGQFYIGDGRTPNTSNFSAGTTTQPVLITSAIQSAGIGAALNYTSATAYGSPVALPSTFPLGYNGFYCMKYEGVQGMFVEFLNSLTYDQQTTLLTENGSSNLPNVVGSFFDLNNQWALYTRVSVAGTYNTVAATFTSSYPYMVEGAVSWKTATSFLDWSGLRPMTEFEFEKACRGTLVPVANEYPWGTTTITATWSVPSSYTDPNAYIATVEGPCFYNNWDGSPQRPGAFARATTNRSQSGATYYGILDMAGNVWEQCVGGGSGYNYSNFTTENGDGVLTSAGRANVVGWPIDGGTSSGTIIRGGWYNTNNVTYEQVSDRQFYAGSANNQGKSKYGGIRGVRSFSY